MSPSALQYQSLGFPSSHLTRHCGRSPPKVWMGTSRIKIPGWDEACRLLKLTLCHGHSIPRGQAQESSLLTSSMGVCMQSAAFQIAFGNLKLLQHHWLTSRWQHLWIIEGHFNVEGQHSETDLQNRNYTMDLADCTVISKCYSYRRKTWPNGFDII